MNEQFYERKIREFNENGWPCGDMDLSQYDTRTLNYIKADIEQLEKDFITLVEQYSRLKQKEISLSEYNLLRNQLRIWNQKLVERYEKLSKAMSQKREIEGPFQKNETIYRQYIVFQIELDLKSLHLHYDVNSNLFEDKDTLEEYVFGEEYDPNYQKMINNVLKLLESNPKNAVDKNFLKRVKEHGRDKCRDDPENARKE